MVFHKIKYATTKERVVFPYWNFSNSRFSFIMQLLFVGFMLITSCINKPMSNIPFTHFAKIANYTFFLYKKEVYKKPEAQIKQELRKI